MGSSALAVALAVGGTCLADIALLREQPGVFGPVASDPTVSRAIDALATATSLGVAGFLTFATCTPLYLHITTPHAAT